MWTTYRRTPTKRATTPNRAHAHVGASSAQSELGNAVVLEVVRDSADADGIDPRLSAAARLNQACSALGADDFGLGPLNPTLAASAAA